MTRTKIISVAFAAALLTAGGAAMAQPGAGPTRPYGDAGCGLGSIVLGNNPGFTQVFAATTNGTFGTQTFGITSGTSNCINPTPGAASARSFSETNRTAMSKEIARGQGETIATLSTLGGCKSSASVGASLQKNFRRIVPNAEVSDRAFGQNVVQVLTADASLSCTKLAPVASR
jgi:Protein of unknown function (DUF3015)